MKNRLLIAMLALAGAAFVTSTHAAPLTYSTGDIILGFELPSGATGNNLEIDLGQFSNLNSFGSINIASDLNSAFGIGNWSNNVLFGAIGVNLNGVTLKWQNIYETTASATALPTFGTASATIQGNYSTLVQDGTSSYANLVTAPSWSASGVGVVTANANNGAWSTFHPYSSDFGRSYGPGIEATIGSSLSLYTLTATGNTTGSLSSVQYNIAVDNSGNLSVSAVPEPSTYVLFGLGALILVVTYRRKTSTSNS